MAIAPQARLNPAFLTRDRSVPGQTERWAIVAMISQFLPAGPLDSTRSGLFPMVSAMPNQRRLFRGRFRACRPSPSRSNGGWLGAMLLVITLTASTLVGATSGAAGSRLSPATPDSEAICATGRLHIADLPALAEPWRITVEADRSLAVEWRPDAVLIATDLSCGFLVDEPRVRTSFYSADAKGVWDPETAQTRPLDPGDPEPKELPADSVSFDTMRQALLGLGLQETDEIGASGITIQLNTEGLPFGPVGVPPETTVVHLTVGDGGATRDVYIDAVSGRTYGYGQGVNGGRPGNG